MRVMKTGPVLAVICLLLAGVCEGQSNTAAGSAARASDVDRAR